MSRSLRKTPVQEFDRLCDERQAIYLANVFASSKLAKGRPAGDIIIGVVDSATKRRMTLALPKNSITCVSDQIGHTTLKDNPDIRKYLGLGVLELFTPEEFETLATEDPDYVENSEEQLHRLLSSLDGNPLDQAEETYNAAAPVLGNVTVRPEVQTLIAKVQFENETEKALLQELKSLAPYSDAEKQNLLEVSSAVPADRPKLRGGLTNIDSTASAPTQKSTPAVPKNPKASIAGKK